MTLTRGIRTIGHGSGIATLRVVVPFLYLALFALGGCTTYSAKFADLRPELADGEFEAALETVEKQSGDKERLLYFLERGIIFHYSDRYVESNEAFDLAERIADNLYTKSISEGAISLLTNDTSISYRARPFEMAMVPYYKGLNYTYLGQRESAVVEARRASQLLAHYVDVTLDGLREEDRSGFEQIRNNAFLRYYSGMLYDWDGEVNDAFIAYRNAAVAYQQNRDLLDLEIPPTLGEDLVRTGRRLGFRDELDQLYSSCPDVFVYEAGEDSVTALSDYEKSTEWIGGLGEVVLLFETGFVPGKSQIRFDIPIFSAEAYEDPGYWSWQIYAGMGNMQALVAGRKVEYWASVAAPQLDDGFPGPARGARVSVDELDLETHTFRTENLSRQARVTFDSEKPTIFFKTILRGLTKYLATRGAEKAAGEWAGLVANIFGAVTETADTRSWLTLPEHIHLARLSLPPGLHDIKVEVLGPQGEIIATRMLTGVEVRAGDWTFLSRRFF